jgi:hypothetical protein
VSSKTCRKSAAAAPDTPIRHSSGALGAVEDDAMAAEARAPGGADRLTLEISMDELERDGYDTNPHDARGEYVGAPKVRTNERATGPERSESVMFT